ncbi:MAG: hypothetical protein WC894_04465 [Patescibacteria group bacterium]
MKNVAVTIGKKIRALGLSVQAILNPRKAEGKFEIVKEIKRDGKYIDPRRIDYGEGEVTLSHFTVVNRK